MSRRNFRHHRPLFSNRMPQAVRRPRIRWKILPILWLALKRTAMVLGFFMIFNFIMLLIVVPPLMKTVGNKPALPGEIVLFLELSGGLAETPDGGGFGDPFADKAMTVRRMVDAIDRAATDNRVKGMLVRLRAGNFELVHIQELRAAVKRLRKSGKFAHIYSSSYGESGGGLGRYYLASAFDEIWMQPMGIVTIPGISLEMPFMRGALDKLGVRPEFFKRKDYKTAYENLTHSEMTKANREMMQRLIDDLRGEIVGAISKERGIPKDEFLAMVDEGLFTADEAERAGLITHANYGDVLAENVAEAVTGKRDLEGLDMVDLEVYAGYVLPKEFTPEKDLLGNKKKVALIYAVGAIMPEEEGGGLGGAQVAAASVIAPEILAVSRDESIDTIVLRVDSPGGSPTASESILRAIEKAKERGKKVIVSMGPVAASGGYWIASNADRIFVSPATLTGSIGVIGGKFSIAEMSEKLGVEWDGVEWGKNAGMWSPAEPFSESAAAQVNAMMDSVYQAFIKRVAEGRSMTPEAVDRIAGGRVWTGVSAVKNGLADEIGGLAEALDFAARSSGKVNRKDLQVIVLPKPKTLWEEILQLLDDSATIGQSVRLQSKILELFAPYLEFMQVRSNDPVSTYEPMRLN